MPQPKRHHRPDWVISYKLTLQPETDASYRPALQAQLTALTALLDEAVNTNER